MIGMKKLTLLHTSPSNKMRGFNLIELMLTIAVIAIALAVAVPNFSFLLESNRVSATTNQIVGALNLGRVEATKQGTRISVFIAEDNANNWGVWRDGLVNENGAFDVGEEIRQFDPMPPGITVTSAPDDHVFSPTGFATAAGTITICSDDSSIMGNQINIALSGRISNVDFNCP